MRPVSLSPQQSEAMENIRSFLQAPGAGVFVLKGYAGTGKTTLLQHLGLWLTEQRENFIMLAPTGRAVAVLKAKTGLEAKTIHSELYRFSDIDGEADDRIEAPQVSDFGQMRLLFSARPPDPKEKKIYIIDEASMVGDEPADSSSYAHFGSGHLLSDLLAAAGSNKIIFAGDPCQLPPVHTLESPALNEEWYRNQGRTAMGYELNQVLRQKEQSGILQLAGRVRKLSQETVLPKWVKLPAKNTPSVYLESYIALKATYMDRLMAYGPEDLMAICYSNHNCNDINQEVRGRLYGKPQAPLQIGDRLMVTQNNYLVPLTNGDFVEVVSIGESHRYCGLNFVELQVKASLTERDHSVLLCEDILFNGRSNLSLEQQRILMIDFSRRMRAKNIKPKSELYYDYLYSDRYLNSLRANFGYAVTCHKGQGGEWKEVYLFLNKGMYVMGGHGLTRWWYTGLTRAKERLYLVDDWWIQ